LWERSCTKLSSPEMLMSIGVVATQFSFFQTANTGHGGWRRIEDGLRFYEAAPEGEVLDLQGLSTLQEVGEVKVADIVTDDDIWVRLQNQVSPPLQIHASGSKPLD